ncbi:MAG: ABC transporter substrate-binding protein, partial [Alphaproteobacteria bacterium]
TDIAARTKLYEQSQVIFKEEAPWYTIAHSVVYMGLAKNVVGYKMDPFGIHRFEGVDLK